ncbi:MAG TPA: sigma-54 dependent transcriptional regulator, partial [Ideonella sp.]|nr:sigma-54 dependent transcriptional regulator [Ideonella sp.]
MNPPSHYSLLVVDDEPDLRTLYELTLAREGYDIETAGSVEEALMHLRDRTFSAVITDMRLPDGSGLDLLRRLEEGARREKAIVITAYGSAENAVEALKAGAYDYLTKPVDLRQFRAVVASAIGRGPQTAGTDPATLPSQVEAVRASRGATAAARADPAPNPALDRMAGTSGAMNEVRALVERVARSMAPVLVSGESGTGKELVARSIHDSSVRAGQPFVPVNCSAIPENLLEAEFFGYRKGSFTGAHEDRAGFFQAANGGTLFLDEIGDLPLAMQSKLLRSIQERSVRPIGAVAEQPVNVRIVSATHKDLGAEVLAGRFRQDLYYRLNVVTLRVPSLRERLEDVHDLAKHFLEKANLRNARPKRLSGSAVAHLMDYSFPGNVRELENLVEQAAALAEGEELMPEDFPVRP